MKIARFYQNTTLKSGDEIDLSAENHRHAIQVLRLKIDDILILFNGNGGEYLASIVSIDKRRSRVQLNSFVDIDRESPLQITLVLAMIKPEKMDFAIQKAVELGVTSIQPMYTKRSVIKIKANRLEKKISHWQGIIIAACEQSGRTTIPTCSEPISFDKCIENYSESTCITMLPNAQEKITDLNKPYLENNMSKENNKITLFIGPEGGFTDEEEQLIVEKSSIVGVNFGSRILRAETAAIAGITAVQLAWGDL